MPKYIVLLILLIFPWVLGLQVMAEEKTVGKTTVENKKISEEDQEIIDVLDILEMLDMLEEMEMMKDLNILIQED